MALILAAMILTAEPAIEPTVVWVPVNKPVRTFVF